MRPHLFRQPFGKKQIERFRRGVGRNVRHRLKRCRGRQNQNVSALRAPPLRQEQSRQVHHCAAIDLHHVQQAFRLDGWQFAVGAESGVVDQQFDFNFLARA